MAGTFAGDKTMIEQVACPQCGKLFWNTNGRKFCCRVCYDKFRRGKKFTEIHKQRIAKSQKEYCQKHGGHFNGKLVTKQHKEKIKKTIIDTIKESYPPGSLEKFIQLSKEQTFLPKYVKKDSCEICNSTKHLIKHHVSYSPVKIVTLCWTCHNYLHLGFLLRKKLIDVNVAYLAHPGKSNHMVKAKEIQSELEKIKIEVLNPFDCTKESRYLTKLWNTYSILHKNQELAERIVKKDLELINSATMLVAYCPEPSFGTAMEIFYASRVLGKPVIILTDYQSPWLMVHGTIVHTVEKLIEEVKKYTI